MMMGIKPPGFGMALSRAERFRLGTLDERDQQSARELRDTLQTRLDAAEKTGAQNPKNAFLALADVAEDLSTGRKERFPHVKTEITVFAEDKASASVVNETLLPVVDRIRMLARRWGEALSLGKARDVLRTLDSERDYTVSPLVTRPLFERLESALSRAELRDYHNRTIEKLYQKDA